MGNTTNTKTVFGLCLQKWHIIFAWVTEHEILACAELCCKLIDYFLIPLCLRESKFAFLFHGLLPALISYCQERKESQHVRLYLILFPCKFCHCLMVGWQIQVEKFPFHSRERSSLLSHEFKIVHKHDVRFGEIFVLKSFWHQLCNLPCDSSVHSDSFSTRTHVGVILPKTQGINRLNVKFTN